MLNGEFLEATCALAKAWNYLSFVKCDENEEMIKPLLEKISEIQREIYNISSGSYNG